MLDKLALTSNSKIDSEYARQQLRGLFANITETGSKYHKKVLSYRISQGADDDCQLVSIHLEPRIPSISSTRIELNPTRFGSYARLTELIQRLLDPDECTITRLDHSVDLPVPIDRINAALTWPRKQLRETYKNSTLTGFYLGRPPEQLLVYDKARESGAPGPLTRMELRQFRDRLHLRSYAELPRLMEYSPFARIQWVNPDARTDDNGTRRKHSVQFLRQMIETGGAQHAFKRMNQHSNFTRNYGDCLSRPESIPDPDAGYRENLRRFFMEVNDGN